MAQMLPKVHSAAYKLFHYPYMWRVADNEMWTENETEYFGIHTSGSATWDANIATAKGDYYLPTADAAYLHSRGVGIDLADPKDAIIIYEMINQHLIDWHEYLLRGDILINAKTPLQGLKAFNALARDVFKPARRNGILEHIQSKPRADGRAKRIMRKGHYDHLELSKINHGDIIMNKITELTKGNREYGGRIY